MKVALWVARRHRPFAIVEDPELLEIFHDLNNKCTTPSASTVSRDVKEIFQVSRKKVAQLLQVRVLLLLSFTWYSPERQAYRGKLHIGVDGWTSPQAISFLGITVHWVVDGKVSSIILDFVKCVFRL
jgi:Na+-transporting NADH:ubiquinone oxidoreductase subunit NqrA